MKLLSRGLYLLLIIISGSCMGLKFPVRNKLLTLDNGAAALNGFYKNNPSDTSSFAVSIWSLLTRKKNNYLFFTKDSLQLNSYVQLIAINKRELRAKLFVDTSFVKEITLKGKIRKDYFSVRRKVKYIGIPFIYVSQFEYKLQIGKDASMLYIDAAETRGGQFLLMTAGTTDHYNFGYEVK